VLVSWPFSFEFLSKMVCHAPSIGFGLFLFVFFIFIWLSIFTSVVFMRSSNLLDPLDFLYHAPTLRGQLWSLSFFALAPSMGCDPSQCYFKKCNRLKMGLQRIYFSLVKGLSKMAFSHLKLMHWGSIGLAFMRVCKMIIHSNKT